jgi:hypothetical protein
MLLLFRDVLLYAGRSLFPHWWAANLAFRRTARTLAVAFKVVLAVPVALVLNGAFGLVTISGETWRLVVRGSTVMQWLLIAGAYSVLVSQLRRYWSTQ